MQDVVVEVVVDKSTASSWQSLVKRNSKQRPRLSLDETQNQCSVGDKHLKRAEF